MINERGDLMTVINKLSQTLEMLKSCESNFNTFFLDTNDNNAKELYKQLSQNVKQCSDMLQSRVDYVLSQEPQYQNELPSSPTNLQNQGMQSQATKVSPTTKTEIPDIE